MTLHADRIGRRALTVGAAAGSILVATLTFAATQADAAYTAQVKAGTLQIRGDGASDKLTLAPTATTLVLDVGDDDTADFTFDRSTFTAVSVQAGDGDDQVRVLNAVTPFDMTIDGGAGDDTLIGGNGNETLLGGSGNDLVDGNIGADTAQMGSGNDTFQWDPGDGSDSVDGQGGNDTIAFNGSNIGEEIHVSGHTLTRNVAAVAMDFTAENVNVTPQGGLDNITVDGTDGDDQLDLTGGKVTFGGTTVSLTNAEPTDRLIADGGAGDDTAVYTGTTGDDQVSFGRNGDAVFVASGDAIANARTEHTLIRGLGGNDQLFGQNGIGQLTQVTLDGGAGDDDLRGGDGADTLIGGSGNDHVDGNIGADTAQMGSGNDTFQWDPGDGSDSVDGQSGTDSLAFNGSNAAEELVASADGSHVRFTRNIAAIAMDLDNVEGLAVRTLGGVDLMTVNDLSGTDMKTAAIDLGAFDGTPDATPDTVTLNGTAKRDDVAVTKAGGQVLVKGLPTQTTIAGSDPGIDLLRVNTLAGDDSVTVAPDVADLIATAVDTGADG